MDVSTTLRRSRARSGLLSGLYTDWPFSTPTSSALSATVRFSTSFEKNVFAADWMPYELLPKKE